MNLLAKDTGFQYNAILNEGQKMSWVKQVAFCIFTLPLMGCTIVPTSVNDARLNDYIPKVGGVDFNYDPYQTPIAQCYSEELSNKTLEIVDLKNKIKLKEKEEELKIKTRTEFSETMAKVAPNFPK